MTVFSFLNLFLSIHVAFPPFSDVNWFQQFGTIVDFGNETYSLPFAFYIISHTNAHRESVCLREREREVETSHMLSLTRTFRDHSISFSPSLRLSLTSNDITSWAAGSVFAIQF